MRQKSLLTKAELNDPQKRLERFSMEYSQDQSLYQNSTHVSQAHQISKEVSLAIDDASEVGSPARGKSRDAASPSKKRKKSPPKVDNSR